jgi:hypothetical protein
VLGELNRQQPYGSNVLPASITATAHRRRCAR